MHVSRALSVILVSSSSFGVSLLPWMRKFNMLHWRSPNPLLCWTKRSCLRSCWKGSKHGMPCHWLLLVLWDGLLPCIPNPFSSIRDTVVEFNPRFSNKCLHLLSNNFALKCIGLGGPVLNFGSLQKEVSTFEFIITKRRGEFGWTPHAHSSFSGQLQTVWKIGSSSHAHGVKDRKWVAVTVVLTDPMCMWRVGGLWWEHCCPTMPRSCAIR